ncbi:MAG: GGDEF domain-containing protein [Candidatus Eremiobacteraeota bacterium]|nr:GGDEF domain-containing protein [Candidatus Eremiobacteraeota bacterium]
MAVLRRLGVAAPAGTPATPGRPLVAPQREPVVRSAVAGLVLALAVLTAPAAAAELRLDAAAGVPDLWQRAEVLRDPTGRWTLDDVRRRDASFRPAATLPPSPRNGVFAPSTLWFRLQPRSSGDEAWVLHVSMNVEQGRLYYVAREGAVRQVPFGMSIPFDERAIRSYRVFAPLPQQALREGTVYVRVVSSMDDFGIFEILPSSALGGAVRRGDDAVLVPLLFTAGMLVALGLVNLLLALILRDRVYLWYALAMFAFTVYDVAQSGLAWRWLWPRASLPYGPVTYGLFLAYFAAVVGFCRGFLELPRTAPIAWRGILLVFGVLVVEEAIYALQPNLLDRAGLFGLLDPIVTTAFLLIVFAAGVVAWRGGNPLAALSCVAFLGVVVGLTINVAGIYDLIPETPVTDAAAGAGVAWEAVFLCVAMADRIRTLSVRAASLQTERDALEAVALHDALTGVPNRRAFERRFEEEWRRATRASSPLAVVLLDIDRFKDYNDAYGHLNGDNALVRVARAIGSALRRPEDFLARYGGEEFVVILPSTIAEDAAAVAESMRRAVCDLQLLQPGGEPMTISAGVASAVPQYGAARVALVSAADRALYAAKNAGRDRVTIAALAPDEVRA